MLIIKPFIRLRNQSANLLIMETKDEKLLREDREWQENSYRYAHEHFKEMVSRENEGR